MRPPQSSYEELLRRLREWAILRSCSNLLSWDEETYMPPAATEHRAEQQAVLAGLGHEKLVDPQIGNLLGGIEASDLASDPLGDVAVNLRETRRVWNRAVKIPKTLIEDLARTTTLATEAWKAARRNNHFPTFQPWLEKVIALRRQQAECIGYADLAYDALIDEFEPGQTTASLKAILQPLGAELVPLIREITASKRKPNRDLLTHEYPVEAQRQFALEAAAAIGFDFNAGRLDVTTHPFCSGIGPGDTRITTRYDLHYFPDAFMGVLHEAGHGIYDQGLPAEHFGTPRGWAVSYGVHESQSRLWENFVGRSHSFWSYFFPKAKKHFPAALKRATQDDFHFALNHVKPSFIRVEADEATYNLHVLVRFELEQDLIAGTLTAEELPAAWNETFNRYLGFIPPDDAQGCLQDIHWSGGSFGYFPSYSLGNLYAAQFFAQARRDLGDLDKQFVRGNFAPLRDWLGEKIHAHGQRYRAAELVQTVTGQPPSHQALIEHLRRKYEELYGI